MPFSLHLSFISMPIQSTGKFLGYASPTFAQLLSILHTMAILGAVVFNISDISAYFSTSYPQSGSIKIGLYKSLDISAHFLTSSFEIL